MHYKAIVVGVAIAFLVGCGQSSQAPTTWWETLYSSQNTLTIRFGYTEGAVPYFDPIDGVNPWIILEYNLRSMFPNRSYSLPKSLDEVYYLGRQEKKLFSKADIRHLANSIPSNPGDLKVVFVDGNPSDIKAAAYNTPDHEVIAIFKPNNTYVPSVDKLWNVLTEQCTLIHEFGHSIGLVNNGLPMVKPHEDPTDMYHEVGENCIMHTFDGLNPLTWPIWRDQRDMTGGSLFDANCIADVRAFQGKNP